MYIERGMRPTQHYWPWPTVTTGLIKAIKGEEVTMCAYVESSLTEVR